MSSVRGREMVRWRREKQAKAAVNFGVSLPEDVENNPERRSGDEFQPRSMCMDGSTS